VPVPVPVPVPERAAEAEEPHHEDAAPLVVPDRARARARDPDL